MAQRTPEGMAGGWRVGRILMIGGVIGAGIAYSFWGGAEETAAPVGVVPRITGASSPGAAEGYVEDKTPQSNREERRGSDNSNSDRGIRRRNDDPRETRTVSRGGARKDDFLERGLNAGLGGFKADKEIVDAAWTKTTETSDFKKSGSKCWLPPGAFIPVRSVTRIVTEKPGIVKAKVTADIWDTSGTCLVIPADSDLVADYSATTTRGEKRVPLSNMEIVRPYPADDTVTIAGVAGDQFGAAGIPGETSSNFLSTALLVTASVGIDLATAALTQGGSLIGPIISRNAGNPLDQIAQDLWNRPSVNRVDETTDMMLILRQGIKGDDFRNH